MLLRTRNGEYSLLRTHVAIVPVEVSRAENPKSKIETSFYGHDFSCTIALLLCYGSSNSKFESERHFPHDEDRTVEYGPEAAEYGPEAAEYGPETAEYGAETVGSVPEWPFFVLD